MACFRVNEFLDDLKLEFKRKKHWLLCYLIIVGVAAYILNSRERSPPQFPSPSAASHFRMSTTHLMQSPAFMSANAWLMPSRFCLCVMNSFTLRRPSI